jgi:molybdate transport system substrate-binding protein
MIALLLGLPLIVFPADDRSHAASFQDGGERGPLTVSAAISLTEALEEIAAAYAQAGGTAVRFNFAGSNVLARQIANGAPVDLFISADDEQMDVAAGAGALIDGTRVNLTGNQLAVVARRDNVELVKASFQKAPPEIRRLAVGDPAAVPAGRYARAYLERQKLWTVYEPRVVPTPNVRAALAAVENGAADAAIVYATDVRTSTSAVLAFLVPPGDLPRIVYPAALVKSSRRRDDAQRFLTFMRGAEASVIFHKHGFVANVD